MAVRQHDSETIREETANVLLAHLLRDHGLAARAERRSRRGAHRHAKPGSDAGRRSRPHASRPRTIAPADVDRHTRDPPRPRRIASIVFPTPTPTPPPTPSTYVVQAGDTLRSIAQQFGTPVDGLIEANDIEDPNLIRTGSTLRIPVPLSCPTAAEEAYLLAVTTQRKVIGHSITELDEVLAAAA